jgi:hypothetical protein
MQDNETPEILLDRILYSMKVRKLAITLVLAGTIICFMLLLPPVRNGFIAFIVTHLSGTSSGLENKLRSLLSLPFFGLVIFILVFCCLFSKTISALLKDVKNRRLIIVLTTITGILLLGFVAIFSYQRGVQWLDSDYSSEMVLGKLLADENAFISRNWHYSTEIRLIYQTIFIMPLFKLIGRYEDWALIRALTVLLNNLVLILSYIFMVRQMKIQTKWICITSLFLIMPLSAVYWDIVTFGGFYTFFIAQLFCCLGLFIRLIGSGTTKTALIDFILFTVLSFALGVQGIRSLLCVHIPLVITCICLYSKTAQKKNFPLFLGCYGFVICCIGFVFNTLLHFWYSFFSFNDINFADLYSEFFPRLGRSIVCLTEFFGFSAEDSLLSVKGLFSVIAIAGTFILFWAVIKSFVQSMEYQFMPAFFIVSVIFNVFVFIIITDGMGIINRYFIPFMVLYIPLTAIIFEHAEKTYGHLKRIAIVSGIILFVFGQGCLNFQRSMGGGGGINNVRKGYIQYLLDNKLDYGFATFWNANVTTELTNGKIELAGLNHLDFPQISILKWLIPEKFFNPSFHQGESFLLLTRAEWELAQKAGRPFTRFDPDYEDNDFIIIRYPSAEIIHREVLDD